MANVRGAPEDLAPVAGDIACGQLTSCIVPQIPHACMKRDCLHRHAHRVESSRRCCPASRDRGLRRVAGTLEGPLAPHPNAGWNEVMRLCRHPEAMLIAKGNRFCGMPRLPWSGSSKWTNYASSIDLIFFFPRRVCSPMQALCPVYVCVSSGAQELLIVKTPY